MSYIYELTPSKLVNALLYTVERSMEENMEAGDLEDCCFTNHDNTIIVRRGNRTFVLTCELIDPGEEVSCDFEIGQEVVSKMNLFDIRYRVTRIHDWGIDLESIEEHTGDICHYYDVDPSILRAV